MGSSFFLSHSTLKLNGIKIFLYLSKTFEKFYGEVSNRRRLQSQRRLFYISNEDANQPHNLLVLQQV